MPQRFALLALAAITGIAHAENFTIDASHTLPVFEVNHLGFSTQRGRFNEAHGTIALDPKARSGRVTLTIEANSIDMGLPKWDEHMKSEDFFHTAKFPTIQFEAKTFEFKDEVPVAASGSLTLLGVTRPVRLEIHGFKCGENPIIKKSVCGANIEAHLKRSEFGMTKYLPAISDDVHVLVPVEAFLNP